MKPPYCLLFLLFALCSCKNEQSSSNIPTAKTANEVSTLEEGDESNEPKIALDQNKRYFVIAASGLNYRTAPKGKVLGKFKLNTEVEITERTGVFEKIKDENVLKEGEWVAVKKDKETVYVFDAFLSNYKAQLLDIFPLYNFNIGGNNNPGFVPLTDSYPWSEHPDSLAVADKYLGNKVVPYFKLSPKYKNRFLYKMGIKETDKVFIFNYSGDKLHTYAVSELPLAAHISPYSEGQPFSQYDYLIGFDLNGKAAFAKHSDAYVYIGKENPFITGQLQAIIWEKINPQLFPSVEFRTNNHNHRPQQKYRPIQTVKFSANKLDYYVQDAVYEEKNDYNASRQIVVLKAKQVIYNEAFFEGESTSFAPLTIAGAENEREKTQWTGKLFKDKPPVIFGLFYQSFGCESIEILDETERSVAILCDNRH